MEQDTNCGADAVSKIILSLSGVRDGSADEVIGTISFVSVDEIKIDIANEEWAKQLVPKIQDLFKEGEVMVRSGGEKKMPNGSVVLATYGNVVTPGHPQYLDAFACKLRVRLGFDKVRISGKRIYASAE